MQSEAGIQQLVDRIFGVKCLADFVSFRNFIHQSVQPHRETGCIFSLKTLELLIAFPKPFVPRSQCWFRPHPKQNARRPSAGGVRQSVRYLVASSASFFQIVLSISSSYFHISRIEVHEFM